MPTTEQATDQTPAQKVVDFIGYTSAALEKAAAAEDRQRETQQKVAAAIPQAVDALVENGHIRPDEKEAAAKALADPVEAVSILGRVAANRPEKQAESLGSPSGGANDQDGLSPFCGVPTSEKRASDLAYERALGLID